MTTTINASTSSGLVTTPDNSGAIALQNAGVTGLNITAAGQVTRPLQPTFWCGAVQTGTAITGGYAMASSNGLVNVGSCFNTSTNTFTAPIAGMYEITFNASSGDTQSHYLYINKNGTGVPMGANQNMLMYTNYTSASINMVLSLNANDTIQWGSRYSSGFYSASIGAKLL